MKRWIIIIVAALAVIGIGLGIFFGVRAANNNNKVDDAKNTSIMYLQDKDTFAAGENVVVRIIKSSDKQMTKVAYSLDAGAEVDFSCTTGESKDVKETVGNGKYTVDTGIELISTAELSAGWHTIVFYSYDAEDTRYVITSTPILFYVSGTSTAAN